MRITSAIQAREKKMAESEKRKQFSIYLPEKLINELDKIAERESPLKRSQIIEIALTEYVRSKKNYELFKK